MQDLVGEDDGVCSADLHVDPGLLLERRHERARELGVLAVVDEDRVSTAATAAAGEDGRHGDGGESGANPARRGRAAEAAPHGPVRSMSRVDPPAGWGG